MGFHFPRSVVHALAVACCLLGTARAAAGVLGQDASHASPPRKSLALIAVTGGQGFTQNQLQTFEEVLLNALDATGRFKVIGQADISALLSLEAQKQATGCKDDTGCMVAIAGALGVDLVATADIGRLETISVASVKVIDVRSASVVARAQQSFRSEDALLDAARAMSAHVVSSLWPGQAVTQRQEGETRVQHVATPDDAHGGPGEFLLATTPGVRPLQLHVDALAPCTTPCSLRLSPGSHWVVTEGSALPRAEVLVSVDRQSAGLVAGDRRLLIAGTVTLAVGVLTTALPLVLADVSQAQHNSAPESRQLPYTDFFGGVAIPFLFIGPAVAVAGVSVLIAYGAQRDDRLTIAPVDQSTDNGSPKLQVTGFGVQPTKDGVRAGVLVAF